MIEPRPARIDEAPACARILQAWLDETPWMPKLHALAETERWVAEGLFPRAEVWVIDEGEVSGFVALEDRREIVQLVLAPLARRRGLGGRLLGAAKARAADGLSLWCFAANAPALRFYAREGFCVVGGTAGENEEGLPDLRLEWWPA